MQAVQAVQAISRINSILKVANFARNHASGVGLGLKACTLYTEDDSTTYVTVSQILME